MFKEEARVLDLIGKIGPCSAFKELIAENDRLIRNADLETGRRIASERSAAYTGLVRSWAAEQQAGMGYDKPFAVVALGGTGRGEMAPHSDSDFAFLFADVLEANPFLIELQRQVLHSDEFECRHGFAFSALPFSLDDVPLLADKQLNAFLDMRPVHDPSGLADQFRERIRATFDPFEHFMHVRGFWKDHWEKAAAESERLDRFEIKHEGLRLFLAGIWTLAGKAFVHSHEIYRDIDDSRDLQAYDFLLRIRAFVHSRKSAGRQRSAGGYHPEDVLGFDDFMSFGEMLGPEANERARFEFANDVRARLLAARRRVARFAKGIIERELKDGRPIGSGNPIVCGTGGFCHTASTQCQTPQEKSRAALSLLLAAQHYGVQIDPSELQTTFRNAGDWLLRVPELSALFYEERGSLADSFEFLAQIEGAEECLFPGYAKFESSLDERVMTQRKSLRGALERQKHRALERYVREGRLRLSGAFSGRCPESDDGVSVEVEAALLDADHLAGIKLALKTKRLPLTADDQVVRQDQSRRLHERFSTGLSEIPVAEYYRPYVTLCDFSLETIRVAEFLVSHRRAFKERAEAGMNDARQVVEFAELCQDEHKMRALFVFTNADRVEWESEEDEPTRWFNIRELYVKTRMRFRSASDHTRLLRASGYSVDQLQILRDFGEDFFGGVYRQYANRFGAHLIRMIEAPHSSGARASILRDGRSIIVGIAARDYRGLAASISGALWHRQMELRQAHLFSATNHGLALDFFHLAPRDAPVGPDLARFIEEVISERRYIDDSDEACLPSSAGTASLKGWRPGQFCLRFEASHHIDGLIYALTYRVFRHLRGNIFGLSAHARSAKAYVSVYLSLPPDLPLEEAHSLVATHF